MLGGRDGEGMVEDIVLLFEYRACGRIGWCRSVRTRNGSCCSQWCVWCVHSCRLECRYADFNLCVDRIAEMERMHSPHS